MNTSSRKVPSVMPIASQDVLPVVKVRSRFYLPSLDGWRAIAILWVMVSHNPVVTIGRFSDVFMHAVGDYGVQLFFAMSGFLICSRLLREEAISGGISLRSFYTRRIFRIQPAQWMYLIAVAFVALRGSPAVTWSGIVGALLMVRNFGYFSLAGWDTGHFWSLAVEEHFYLLFPAFLLLFRRHRLPLMVAILAASELWRLEVYRNPSLQNLGIVDRRTDMSIGVILMGCIFAEALTRQKVKHYAQKLLKPWVAMVCTAVVFWIIVKVHHSRLDHILMTTVFTMLIVSTALHKHSWTTSVLELAPLRYLGRISYSLYIWQQPFFNYVNPPAPHSLRSHVALCWCISIALAIASYYLIEKPLIRVGHRIAKKFDPAPWQA